MNDLKARIEEACKKVGYEVLKYKRYSNHPDDSHLFTVLAYNGTQYVTWIFNNSTDRLNLGHYIMDKEIALDDYKKRVYTV